MTVEYEQAHGGGAGMGAPVTPDEVVSMATYLGVSLQQSGDKGGASSNEYHLLTIAREAVSAPLLPPWQELEDHHGQAYYYNRATKKSSRRHPLDSKFLELVKTKRESMKETADPSASWMLFEAEDGKEYWFDFATGKTEQSCGGKEIPKLDEEEIPRYDPGTAPVKSALDLDVLTFRSWWYDNKTKHYVTVQFDVAKQTFQLHLDNDRTVNLYSLSGVTAKHGMPVQCWDLHVGAKLNILGKATTLMQADGATVAWLEHHAKRLTKEKDALAAVLKKYQTRPLPMAVTFVKGARQPGGTSLRALMDQIQKLRTAVAVYRPGIAEGTVASVN